MPSSITLKENSAFIGQYLSKNQKIQKVLFVIED
jgi:hypothetical protein